MISYVLAVIAGLLVIGADQYTKYLVVSNMELYDHKDFLPGFINFSYIHNKGGAWGFLDGYTWILVSVTVLAMLIFLTVILRKGAKNKYIFWCAVLILSGGIGNLIDRVFRGGNVIDFINFEFITFPVFNVADCAVVLGVTLILIYFIRDMILSEKSKSKL